jgi:hypothetical protein
MIVLIYQTMTRRFPYVGEMGPALPHACSNHALLRGQLNPNLNNRRDPKTAPVVALHSQRIADRTNASVVKNVLSTAPMLMYQHSRSGVSIPGR